MKTLCQLVLQYKSDVETRIQCIKDEIEDIPEGGHIGYGPDIEDCDEQLAHWQTKLDGINETIENSHLEFELDNPEVGDKIDIPAECENYNCATCPFNFEGGCPKAD